MRYLIFSAYTIWIVFEAAVMPFLWSWYTDKLGDDSMPVFLFFVMSILCLSQLVLWVCLGISAITGVKIKDF